MWCKCSRGILYNFTLTLRHGDIARAFHLDEKSRHFLILWDLVAQDLVTPLYSVLKYSADLHT